MGSWLTIVNPAAGGGRCKKRVAPALERLRASGLKLEVVETGGPGGASHIAREAMARGQRDFIAVGGDGTNFEVLNGLVPLADPEDRPRLASLPLGTGNSFLRDFEILDSEAALQAVLRGQSRTVDVIRCDHTQGSFHYMNILGLGFSARVGAVTNRYFKWAGSKGYIFGVLACLVRMKYATFPVRLDGGERDERLCTMLSFCNSRFTGGDMMMAPEADVADGLLDVIRVGRLGRWRMLRTFPKLFEGSHVSQARIEQNSARRVELDMDEPRPVLVDGEIFKLRLQTLEVQPGVLDVIV